MDMEAPVVIHPPTPEHHVVFRLQNLTCRFGSRRILRGVTLDIYRGETLVILGGSGSGKTTLLRHLMGLIRPGIGEVIRMGIPGSKDIDMARATDTDIDMFRQHLGVVFQGAALLNSLSVFENVGLPLIEVEHCPIADVHDRVVAALRRVYLPVDEILQLKPADLSGGMRKRVGIARAIIENPSVILYDEPTSGLDPVTANEVNDLIMELQKNLGLTSVVISHDISATYKVADRIALLYKGRIVALGSKEETRLNPHPVLQQMLTGATHGPITDDSAA